MMLVVVRLILMLTILKSLTIQYINLDETEGGFTIQFQVIRLKLQNLYVEDFSEQSVYLGLVTKHTLSFS